jgi:hypothetical protein
MRICLNIEPPPLCGRAPKSFTRRGAASHDLRQFRNRPARAIARLENEGNLNCRRPVGAG